MLHVFGKGIEFPFNLPIRQAHLSQTVSLIGLTKTPNFTSIIKVFSLTAIWYWETGSM